MHFNSGYRKEALPLVQRFIDTFEDAEIVVSPSSSCVAMIREHFPMVAKEFGDRELERRVDGLIPRVYELTELLVNRFGIEDVGAHYPHKVTYHPSCHSLRMLHLGDAPLRLLRKVDGIELVELANASECCGFGGTFAIKNAETSSAMVADKAQTVLETGADVCTANDNSCLMNIFGTLHRQGSPVKTVHIAEILASTREGNG